MICFYMEMMGMHAVCTAVLLSCNIHSAAYCSSCSRSDPVLVEHSCVSVREQHLQHVGDARLVALLPEKALDILLASWGQVVLLEQLLQRAPAQAIA